MAIEKRKKVILNTPTGSARYPWLSKPDSKFVIGGQYKTDLVFSNESEIASLVKPLDALLEGFADEKRAELKPADAKKLTTVPYVYNEEDSDGEETGRVFLRFKLNAVVEMKDGKSFTQKPNGFDAAGTPLPATVAVYGGSELKVNFEAVPYYNAKDKAVGLTFRLRAYKVIKLSGGGGSAVAGTYGFGDVEEGYVAITTEESDTPFTTDDAPVERDDF